MDNLTEIFEAARSGFASVVSTFGLVEGRAEGRGHGRWIAYRSPTHDFVLHVEAGDAPWMAVKDRRGQSQDVERIARERAAARDQALPPRPHRDSRSIGTFLGQLCRDYLREELEGAGAQAK